MRQLLIGCGLVVLAFLTVSGVALWEDGAKWAGPHKAPQREAEGRQSPSYVETNQLQWTTPAVLRAYARAHYAAILQEMQQEQKP